MLRATFFALGMFVLMWGACLFYVDEFVLAARSDAPGGMRINGRYTTFNTKDRLTIDPPEWAAVGLLSLAAVTLIYSIALPRERPKK